MLKNRESDKFKAYWYKYEGIDQLPSEQWHRYFKYNEVGDWIYVLVDKEKKMHQQPYLVMSNSITELRTNQIIMDEARGDVLSLGLGINFIADQILSNPKVTSFTVIEKYPEIIEWYGRDDFTIIQGDARYIKLDKKYDVIWDDVHEGACLNMRQYLKSEGQHIIWNAE